MAVATVWTRNCQKEKSEKCANYKWIPDSSELDLFALTPPYKCPCTRLCATLALSLLSLIPPFFESAILANDGPKMKNSIYVGLSVHDEDEDDEKYVFQLKLNHSTCFRTAGSRFILSCPQMHWNLRYSFVQPCTN